MERGIPPTLGCIPSHACENTRLCDREHIHNHIWKGPVGSVVKQEPIRVGPTVYDYLKYNEETCVCNKVSRYDIRGKKMLAFEEKMYVCDLGFFHMKKNRVKDEYNYLVETICQNELIASGYKVYIGKTHKGEVDFIAERGRTRFYVQAAYLLADETVIEREFGAYDAIRDHYPKYVITMDRTTLSRDGIIHMSLIDILLHDNAIS